MIFDVDYAPHLIKSNQLLAQIQKSLLGLNTEEALELTTQTLTEVRLLRVALLSERHRISQKPSPE